jgi:L,D-transpeptidase YcbB
MTNVRPCRHFQRVSCLALLVFSFAGCGRNRDKSIKTSGRFASSEADSGPQRLTADGKALLHSLVDAAELPALQWPNFANYQNEVKEFYDAFSGTLPWIWQGKPTPQARAIVRSLKDAETKGLRPEDYDGSRWDERLAQLEQSRSVSESDLIRFDLALTVSTMRYVSDLHIGRVNPRLFHFDFEIDHRKLDLSEFLRKELIKAHDIDITINTVEPPFPVYRRTEAALKTYLELARRDDGAILPVPSRTVRPGDSYAGVPRLVRLLSLLGDLPGEHGYTEDTYQGAFVDGVKRFQQRHGLDPNGLIDAATLRELNTPLSHRVIQLQITMERLRWLPHEFDRPPIVVNIPEFRLHVDNEEYHWVLSMKVVVGRAYRHQTPVFASEIRSVIFRPYWDVPSSILRAELIPHFEKNPSYFSENSYEIVDKNGRVVSEGTVSQEIEQRLRAGVLGVRQKPGSENALGLVKFDIPSRYDVYLHGTPATQLFSRSRRDFSHGCIRAEDPVALAEWVLRDKPAWTVDNIQTAMNGDKTIQVKLDKPIPVLILYSTAVVMEDGEVRFFEDIYGHDAALERVLAEGYPYSSSADFPAGR